MRNVRRVGAFEGLFQRFTEKPHPISKRPIFTTQRDFLCFLAVLGFHSGERVPLNGKTIELDGRVFETNEQSRDLVYLIALAASKDAGILQPDREDELVQVFEEFVSAGFKVLEGWMVACPDDHIGDQAILTALRRDGFFGGHTSSLKKALENIQF